MKQLFEVSATSEGGREGVVKIDDGSLALDLAMPGSAKEGFNPEQLFAMSYSSCFDSALHLMAKGADQQIDSRSTVNVSLNQGAGGYSVSVKIKVSVIGVSQEMAEYLVQEAHANCPYSKAIQGNVKVEFTVSIVEFF